MRPLTVVNLGRRPYGETLELQRGLRRRRIAGELAGDLLLLVEHDPVVTLGRGTRAASLPLPPDELRRNGIDVFEVERGGDVTWHGPGQLVGYPIINLVAHRQDLHWYLRQLEQCVIDALGALYVPATRNPGLTGVWTRGRKIASIGIHVKQWVTLHGFALNVTADLSSFGLIVPCGIAGVTMASVAAERGGADDPATLWAQTIDRTVEAFGATFSLVPVHAAIEADGTIVAEAALQASSQAIRRPAETWATDEPCHGRRPDER